MDIPEIVLAAYRNAELTLAQLQPRCGLDWTLLAGIGRIESGHASNGNVDAVGTTLSPILGPALDGSLPGNEVIRDARGDAVRAIGPMQFLPSTWAAYASDGDGDGVTDPNNVFDAALAAGRYLCATGSDLRDPDQRLRAVLRYNNSASYASDVLSWSAVYGGKAVPSATLDWPPATPQKTPDTPEKDTPPPASADPSADSAAAQPPRQPVETMILIPGLPPIPCGIFCPPEVAPSAGQ
ncbi:lytic transglycosylase domain-containing protein [Nocardia terrae]|nr:lytic transglycosylase domain-containing protein [Nocardia terrae]